jgi:Raf kinase inhibitor-like YbhB/YbcL family protein
MSESEQQPEHSGESITTMRIQPITQAGVTVFCPVQEADGRLPDRYSGYHDNISPPLSWTSVPDVKAWAIVVEDPDAPQETPFVHWMAWNIQGELTAIPEDIGANAQPLTPQGMVQGRNGMGGHGWFGPRPPVGHGVHRYYFQVFALSETIEMGPETPLENLVNALKARTLAKGEMMATYEAPEESTTDDGFRYKTEGGGGGKGKPSHSDEDPARNATVRHERASPGDRNRGETSVADQT